MDIRTLRDLHPSFTYTTAGFKHRGTELIFFAEFTLEPNITFRPQVVIANVSPELFAKLDITALQQYAFLLGLAEIPSYWKVSCSPTISITATSPVSIDIDLQNYLYDLLLYGLSEFYFVNKITGFNQPNFVTLQNQTPQVAEQSNPTHTKHTQTSPLTKVLLPLGGGKDSLVASKILSTAGLDASQIGILVLEPASPAAQAIANQSGFTTHLARRTIDPILIELNHAGYLNGHTPFSAYLSVLSSAVGYIFDYSHVALANERSANEGNIEFNGIEINHQWSKSFTYEQLFQQISERYLPAAAPFYFSVMRPLYELQIAQLFGHFYADTSTNQATLHPALYTFRSCNRGQQQNRRCGECPKCLFAYVILGPFLTLEQLQTIFGQDLLAKPEMIAAAYDLLGKGSVKPLECVGMYEESLLASYLLLERHYAGVPDSALPLVLAEIKTKILTSEHNLRQRALELLASWNTEHAVPPSLATPLKNLVLELNHAA